MDQILARPRISDARLLREKCLLPHGQELQRMKIQTGGVEHVQSEFQRVRPLTELKRQRHQYAVTFLLQSIFSFGEDIPPVVANDIALNMQTPASRQ
ncbi:MAG: hypothetical protein C0494_09415 [Sphingobium sp.]|nr:hypothetical protein [Sphingobium sp.]